MKPSTSFRLSKQSLKALEQLAKFYGQSKTGVIERLLREKFEDVRDLIAR